MAIIRNRVDWLLRSTAAKQEVIDIRELGGSEASQLVVTLPGDGTSTVEGDEGGSDSTEGDDSRDVTIEGSETEAFDFVTWSKTVTVPSDGEYRERMPLDAPQYIRISSSAPSGAILWVRY